MIPYRNVKSSWVDGFGFNSNAQTLYVGTKGKFYEVTSLAAGDLELLLATESSGGSVGSLVGKLFTKGNATQVEWQVILNAIGTENQPVTAAAGATSKQTGKKSWRTIAEIMLPQARTGLFQFQ